MPNITHFKTREEYNQWYREYRERNREKIREYNLRYNKNWRHENGSEAEKRYDRKYPEKLYARRLLCEAVKKGIIKRGNCEVCKKPNAQGHHEDYYKPLEVRWFCPLHHKHHHLSKERLIHNPMQADITK
jgi:hypothetical protein